MSQSVEDRLAKLLTLAEHASANPNEAANAASLAASLAAQHGIDLDDIRKKSGETQSMTHALSEWHFTKDYADAVWVVSLWVGKLFGASPLLFDPPDAPGIRIGYFGKPHSVKLAHSWLDYVWRSCLTANTEHSQRHKYGSPAARQTAREHFRRAYCMAVALGLKQRVAAMRDQQVRHSDGRSVALIDHLDQETRAAEAFRDSLSVERKVHKSSSPDFDSAAAQEAWEAGKKLSLEDQITNG